MVKKTCGTLAAAALLLGLSACNDENPWAEAPGNGQGAIRLALSADGDVRKASSETRADGAEQIAVPDIADFRIRLEKEDGTYAKDFSYQEFMDNTSGYSTGNYVITAYYGDVNDEGFEKSAFSGSEKVLVLEDRESKVNIHAKVAHSLVSVVYTDAFRNYMSDYSTIVHSEGHSDILMEADEVRPAFVVPGSISLTLSFTNPQGQSLTIQPTTFEGESAHHYVVTLDVNGGETGDATLKIEFDDLLEKEDVEIDLTQELFTSKAPVVTPGGFDNLETLEFLAYEAPEGNYKFDVTANGGLKELKLQLSTLEGDFTPKFGSEVELIGAPESLINQLEESGFRFWGLKNADKMAVVDFSDLGNLLPAGKYELSLTAIDRLTRSSEPVSVIINSVAASLKTVPNTSLYGTNIGNLTVSYNGNNPEKAITFMAKNQNGIFVAAPVISCTAANTRAIESKDYNFTVRLQDMEQDPLEIKTYLNGEYVETVILPVEIPDFTADVDAFARKVVIRINATEEQKEIITDNVKIYDGTTRIPEIRISRNGEKGLITVSGLNPDTQYDYAVSLRSATQGAKDLGFKTEALKEIANGSFDDSVNTINIVNINNGGEYKAGVHSRCYNTTDIVVNEPGYDWATLNQLTCYEGSSTRNTWFMVPSTYVSDGAVKIRSVAYSHNGVEPEYKNYGILGYTWYSQNTPASIDSRTSGELFLGAYSYNGSVSRTDGIKFESRPSSVSFQYAYKPYGDETGEVYIAVLDNSGNVISSAVRDLSAASELTDVTVALPDYAFGQKASKIQIRFRSTKGETVSTKMPSGTALNDTDFQDNSIGGLGVTPPANSGFHISANNYFALSTGSELTIDNVTVNY